MIDTSLHQSEPVMLPGRSSGRLARSVLGYSLLTALMIVTGMPVFVPVALLHCGIRNGRRAAWMTFLLTASLVALYALSVAAAQPALARSISSQIAGVMLVFALPAMAALPLVERGESFGRVLLLMLICSALGMALTEAGSRSIADWSPFAEVLAETQKTNAKFLQVYRQSAVPAEGLQFAEWWLRQSAVVLPALMLTVITVFFTLNLLMFGRLSAWRELRARRQPVESAYLFRKLAFPDWLLFAFIIGGLTPLTTGLLQKVAANVIVVVAFLYILQGLAIFRFLLAAVGASVIGMMLSWILLVLLVFTGVGLLLSGVAGLFDPFFDFRKLKKRKDDSHESHSD